MQRRTWFSLGFVVLCGCCSAQKIEPVAPKKGAYSISFSIQWLTEKGFGNITQIRFIPSYFIADSFEVRVPLALMRGANADESVYGIGARWHFLKGSGVKVTPLLDPFVGVEYQHAFASHFHEDFSALQIGANYFVANNVAVTGVVQFGSDRTPGSHESTFDIAFGFSVFFGR